MKIWIVEQRFSTDPQGHWQFLLAATSEQAAKDKLKEWRQDKLSWFQRRKYQVAVQRMNDRLFVSVRMHEEKLYGVDADLPFPILMAELVNNDR